MVSQLKYLYIYNYKWRNWYIKLKYIYIYIYILSSTDRLSLYHISSVWLDTKDAWSWDRNPPNFTLDLESDRSANKRTTVVKELLCSNSVRLFIFYTLPDTRVLHSFEELCIMRASAENSFARVLNPYGGAYILSSTDRRFRCISTLHIYIVIHRQTCFVLSELFSVARQARFPKLGSKPGWLKRQTKILTLSLEDTRASEGNLNAYVSHLSLFYIYPLNGYRELAIYIYIYIYMCVIFGQVKPEFGVIPSGPENHSRAEHLNFPGRKLNVIYYKAIFL